jgi:quinol monooxygenase YgiN
MAERLIVIDSSAVREGKLEELKKAIKSLVAFVESNEPRPIAYDVYLDEAGTRMTVVQVHPDSASMELHMKVAGPAFSKFVDLIALSVMDVYGTPSDNLMEQLQQKVRMLGKATVVVHRLQAGFARFGLSAA